MLIICFVYVVVSSAYASTADSTEESESSVHENVEVRVLICIVKIYFLRSVSFRSIKSYVEILNEA